MKREPLNADGAEYHHNIVGAPSISRQVRRSVPEPRLDRRAISP
ncbi:MAG: hypothetical protein ACO3NE_13555 [Alphaproteobacteria bacterium]